jgi:hypothetical protein
MSGGSTSLQRRRSSGVLATEIRAELDAMDNAFTAIVAHAIRVGHLLLEAKGRVEHGQWEAWVRENVPLSLRNVQRFTQLAKNEAVVSEAHTITEALAAVSTPRLPAPPPSPKTTDLSLLPVVDGTTTAERETPPGPDWDTAVDGSGPAPAPVLNGAHGPAGDRGDTNLFGEQVRPPERDERPDPPGRSESAVESHEHRATTPRRTAALSTKHLEHVEQFQELPLAEDENVRRKLAKTALEDPGRALAIWKSTLACHGESATVAQVAEITRTIDLASVMRAAATSMLAAHKTGDPQDARRALAQLREVGRRLPRAYPPLDAMAGPR